MFKVMGGGGDGRQPLFKVMGGSEERQPCSR